MNGGFFLLFLVESDSYGQSNERPSDECCGACVYCEVAVEQSSTQILA